MDLYKDNEAALRAEKFPLDEFLRHFGFDEGVEEVKITSALPFIFDGVFRTALQKPPEIVGQLKHHTWEEL